METIDKLKIIDNIPHEGATIEVLGKQSIKITHLCGCWFVQHFYTKKVDPFNKWPQEKRERIQANLSYYVELCKEHEK